MEDVKLSPCNPGGEARGDRGDAAKVARINRRQYDESLGGRNRVHELPFARLVGEFEPGRPQAEGVPLDLTTKTDRSTWLITRAAVVPRMWSSAP